MDAMVRIQLPEFAPPILKEAQVSAHWPRIDWRSRGSSRLALIPGRVREWQAQNVLMAAALNQINLYAAS